MNPEETRAWADERMAAAEADEASAQSRYGPDALLSRLLYSGAATIRWAAARVVWHVADMLERLDAIVTLSGLSRDRLEAIRDLIAGLPPVDLSAVTTGLANVDDHLGMILASSLEPAAPAALLDRLDALHADLVALLPVAPLAPVAGVVTFVGAITTPVQLVPLGGHVDRISFFNAAGAALEFEVRLGSTRIEYMRLTPNSGGTVGPFKATAAVMIAGVSGSIANFALLRWSVVYR